MAARTQAVRDAPTAGTDGWMLLFGGSLGNGGVFQVVACASLSEFRRPSIARAIRQEDGRLGRTLWGGSPEARSGAVGMKRFGVPRPMQPHCTRKRKKHPRRLKWKQRIDNDGTIIL